MSVATPASYPSDHAARRRHRGHCRALALIRPLGLAAALAAGAILACHGIGFVSGYRPWTTAPGTSPMTAVTLLLIGIGLAHHELWRQSRPEIAFVGAALAIALTRMAEIAFGFSVLPWTMVQSAPHAPPIVFGWNSALGAVLCAITILSLRHVRTSVIQSLASLSLAVPMIALIGYSYGLTTFYGQSAVYTAIILAVLAVSAGLASAHRGIIRVLLGPFATGRLARIQLLGAFFVPYVIGALLIHAGAGHAMFVIGIGVVSTTIFMTILMSLSLLTLDRMDGQRRRAEQAAYHDATHDHLTGLANRRMFIDFTQMALSRTERQWQAACLVMIDIDHFKAINDRFGHVAGDQVLRRTATLIAQNIRAGDLAARIGGEEFALFLPNTPAENAKVLVERLRTALASADFSKELEPGKAVTMSAGITTRTAQCADVDAMLKAADGALYTAKARGRNRVEQAA